MSPEPVSLIRLMHCHDPSAVKDVQDMGSGKILELADRVSNLPCFLHLLLHGV